MQFSFQNLGVIKEAEIDLSKDLIILSGKNNSGKTYLAYALYGFLKFAQEDSRLLLSNLDELIAHFWASGLVEINLVEIFQTKKEAMLPLLEKVYLDYLPTVFASTKEFFHDTRVKITLSDEYALVKIHEAELSNILRVGANNSIHLKKDKNSAVLKMALIKKDGQDEVFEPHLGKDFLSTILNSHITNIFQSMIFGDAHIAPAERTAINIFSKALSEKRNELVEQLMSHEAKNTSIKVDKLSSRYPLPIKDSLSIANRLDLEQRKKSDYAALADEIEKDILGGKIKIDKTSGEPQFVPLKSKKNIGIHLSASMVKSLSSIVFYCRHLANKDELFIIDEPELNLHPDNQRKIARIIAKMVNSGIRVLISTHSDYIIRELNNLIMLHSSENEKAAEKLMKKYGYQKSQVLDPKKIGVYLFTSEVKALEVSNTGFEIETIDEEINNLNDSSREIFFTLHE